MDVKARFTLTLFLAVAALLCASCGSGSGTIRGVIGPCLGAAGHARDGEYFDLQVLKGKTEVEGFVVRYPWNFQVSMPPGVYTVTAGQSNLPATVVLRDGQTVQTVLGSDCG